MTPLLLSLDALTPIVEHTPRDQVHRSEGRGRGRMPSPGRTRGSSLGAFSIYLDPPADVLLAVTGDDEDNLVASLLAKQEFGVPRVIARVNHPANEWMFTEMWGVDIAVSAPHLLSALVEEAVSVGSIVRLLRVAGGKARLIEVTLSDDSPVIGRQLVDAGFPRGSSVVAIVRSGNVVVPRGDTSFHVGDEVIVLVTDEAEAEVTALLVR